MATAAAVGTARAVIVALLVLSPFLVSAWRVYAFPTLSDISTDLDRSAAARRRRAAAHRRHEPGRADLGGAGRLQTDAYPDVTGRRYPLSADRVQELAAALVAGNGWTLTAPPTPPLDGGDGMIEALAKTSILAFPVDVSIRVTDEGETSYVDMRSASRYGRHDLGDNAARITDFLIALDAAVAGAAGTTPAEPAAPPADAVPIPVPSEPPPQSDAPAD